MVSEYCLSKGTLNDFISGLILKEYPVGSAKPATLVGTDSSAFNFWKSTTLLGPDHAWLCSGNGILVGSTLFPKTGEGMKLHRLELHSYPYFRE